MSIQGMPNFDSVTKIIMTRKVCFGYPNKTDLTGTWFYLPYVADVCSIGNFEEPQEIVVGSEQVKFLIKYQYPRMA
jgi:hypothetical protein